MGRPHLPAVRECPSYLTKKEKVITAVKAFFFYSQSRARNIAAFGSARLAREGRGSAIASLYPIHRPRKELAAFGSARIARQGRGSAFTSIKAEIYQEKSEKKLKLFGKISRNS